MKHMHARDVSLFLWYRFEKNINTSANSTNHKKGEDSFYKQASVFDSATGW
jgi:hypothetical protein